MGPVRRPGGGCRRATGTPRASARRAGNRGRGPRWQSDPGPRAHGRRKPGGDDARPRMSIASYVPQLSTERFAGAGEAGFDRPDGNPEREADLLVTESVDFPKHERSLLVEREPVERRPDALCELLLAEEAIRGAAVALCGQLAVVSDVFVERNLLGPV